MMTIDAMETKSSQPKINHYKFMKQKVKSTDIKNKNNTFQDYLAKWDKEEDTEEKLTMPISVSEHYKKYTVEEQNIIWKNPFVNNQ